MILQQELADNLPTVTGDRVQFQQVIMNLLRNASDSMSEVDDRPRQLLIRTEVDEDDRVRLTVKDAGVGFAPQSADRLFERPSLFLFLVIPGLGSTSHHDRRAIPS